MVGRHAAAGVAAADRGLKPEARQAPDWSADSRHLLVVGRDEHGEAVVYEIAPRDEQLHRLPVPAEQPLQALYGADAEQLLVVERDADQHTRLSLFDRSAQPWRRLASPEGVSQARFDRSTGRVLFTGWQPVGCGRWTRR